MHDGLSTSLIITMPTVNKIGTSGPNHNSWFRQDLIAMEVLECVSKVTNIEDVREIIYCPLDHLRI